MTANERRAKLDKLAKTLVGVAGELRDAETLVTGTEIEFARLRFVAKRLATELREALYYAATHGRSRKKTLKAVSIFNMYSYVAGAGGFMYFKDDDAVPTYRRMKRGKTKA